MIKTFKNKKAIFLTAGVFVLSSMFTFVSNTANAMIIRAGESYELEESATLDDDLYIFGEVLNVFGTTTGDVFAGGSRIKQTGVIGEDGLFIGANVDVPSDVSGDLRIVGNVIHINGHVKEDVVAVGNSVFIGKDAVIDGDLLVFSDYLSVLGNVKGLSKLYVNTVEIKGSADGGFDISAKEAVSVTGDTKIKGDFIYSAPRKAFISDDVVIDGEIKYNNEKVAGSDTSSGNSGGIFKFILYLLATAISAIAFVFFFNSFAEKLTDMVINKTKVMDIIKAFLLLFIWPVLSVFLMFTIVAFIPGMVMLLLYVLMLLLALAFSPIVVGVILAKMFKKEEEGLDFAWVVFGVVVFSVLGALPLFGFLLKFTLLLMSFFAISVMFYKSVHIKKK